MARVSMYVLSRYYPYAAQNYESNDTKYKKKNSLLLCSLLTK
jgi:hypothetical protein